MKKLFCILLFVSSVGYSQDTLKIMFWNLLNYNVTDTVRNPYYRTVIEAVNPDILVVEEIGNQATVDEIVNHIMNFTTSAYSAGTFIDGYDTDNALFYKSSNLTFLTNTPIHTELRDINEFKLYHNTSLDTFRIYSAHLKASNTSADAAQRGREVDLLRNVTNGLGDGKIFFVCGDFNIYSSTEIAYQKLLQDNVADDGNFCDPIYMTGNFNQAKYAAYHTQSTRVRAFGGGATSGLDDRFDFLLYSTAVKNGERVSYVANSMTACGNDGNHYNDSINRQPNTAVPSTIADALYLASDHLPVIAKFVFKQANNTPIELLNFKGSLLNKKVILEWSTATESNNNGFEVERIRNEELGIRNWEKIGFVKGSGNSITIKNYSYEDAQINFFGNYSYRLKQIDINGEYKYYKEINVEYASMENFLLR